MLSINTDDPAVARKLVHGAGMKATLLYDGGAVADRYGVSTIPHLVLIDRLGVVRGVYHGGNLDKALTAKIEGLLE